MTRRPIIPRIMQPQLVTSGSSAALAATHTTAPTTCCRGYLTTVLKTAAITAAIAAVVFATYTVSSVFLPYPILATTAICASIALIVLTVMRCRSRIPEAPPMLMVPLGPTQNLIHAVTAAKVTPPPLPADHARKASGAIHTELQKKFAGGNEFQARFDQLEKMLNMRFEQLEKEISSFQENSSVPPLLVPSPNKNLGASIDALAKKVESKFSELQLQIATLSDQLKVKGPNQEKQSKGALPAGHIRVPSSMDAENLPSLKSIVIPMAPPLQDSADSSLPNIAEDSDMKDEDGLKTPPSKPNLARRKSEPSPQVKQEAGGPVVSHESALLSKAVHAAALRKTQWVSPLTKKAKEKQDGKSLAVPGSIQELFTKGAATVRRSMGSPPASPDSATGSVAGKKNAQKNLSMDWGAGSTTSST